jgi:hypothetical protein
MWSGCIWLRREASGYCCENGNEISGFMKMDNLFIGSATLSFSRRTTPWSYVAT